MKIRRHRGWRVSVGPSTRGVHVVPVGDLMEHDVESVDCVCGPNVQYVDDDGDMYPRGPLVVHYSLDGREANE